MGHHESLELEASSPSYLTRRSFRKEHSAWKASHVRGKLEPGGLDSALSVLEERFMAAAGSQGMLIGQMPKNPCSLDIIRGKARHVRVENANHQLRSFTWRTWRRCDSG